MWLRQLRILMVIVTQLAFYGQAIAAVQLPCDVVDHFSRSSKQASTQTAMQPAVHMEMSHHQHLALEQDPANELPACCDHQHCAKTHCASTGYSVAAVNFHTHLPSLSTSVLNTEYAVSYQSSDPSSLYRPPNTL